MRDMQERNAHDDHNLSLSFVDAAARSFSNNREMVEAMSLALASGEYLIFFGPGGHGKSEIVNTVFGAVDGTSPYVKSLSGGTTHEELFGGLDLKAFNDAVNPGLRFNVSDSFMTRHLVCLEELFDAPPRVLTALKDTLTSGWLRNGNQQEQLQTTVLVALTNRAPGDIAKLGPDVAALIERFAIQLEVKWQSYVADDYRQMVNTIMAHKGLVPQAVGYDVIQTLQSKTDAVKLTSDVLDIVAMIAAELSKDSVVSPRTFMKGIKLIKAAAAINDRDYTVVGDIMALRYLTGIGTQASRIGELIDKFEQQVVASLKLSDIGAELAGLRRLADITNSAPRLDEIMQTVEAKKKSLDAIQIDYTQTDLLGRRSDIRNVYDDFWLELESRLGTLKRDARKEQERGAAANQLTANRDYFSGEFKLIITRYRSLLDKASTAAEISEISTDMKDLRHEIHGMSVSIRQKAKQRDAMWEVNKLIEQAQSRSERLKNDTNGYVRK